MVDNKWRPPVGKHVECPQCNWWFHDSTVFKETLKGVVYSFCSIECRDLFRLDNNIKLKM